MKRELEIARCGLACAHCCASECEDSTNGILGKIKLYVFMLFIK